MTECLKGFIKKADFFPNSKQWTFDFQKNIFSRSVAVHGLRLDIIWKVSHNAIEIGNAWLALSL